MDESDETLIQDEPELDTDETDDSMEEESYDSKYGIMRDQHGRFAPVMSLEEFEKYEASHENDILIEKKIREAERQYEKKVYLKPNEKHILFQLVDKFRDVGQDLDTGEPIYNLSQFKPKPYHEILINHQLAKFTESKVEPGKKILTPTSRVMFTRFVNDMISQGLVEKIKRGRHLYLRITKKGLDKTLAFYEMYSGEIYCLDL